MVVRNARRCALWLAAVCLVAGCAAPVIAPQSGSAQQAVSELPASRPAMGANPPVFHDFPIASLPGSPHLAGGISVSSSGDVFVATDAYYNLVHLSLAGIPNALYVHSKTSGWYYGPPVFWSPLDQRLYYSEFVGLGGYLGVAAQSGPSLKNIPITKYGSTGMTFALGADDRVWVPHCDYNNTCDNGSGGELVANKSGANTVAIYSLGGWIPNGITAGPGNDLYVTERVWNDPVSAVARVSTTGSILQTTLLPNGAIPDVNATGVSSGIAEGPDGNLWIVENGTNQIAKLSLTKGLKQFNIPTPNADARNITVAPNGVLYFTEYGANKIGKIQSGVITEYPLPTANAHPDGIASCHVSGCPTTLHGSVWFTEDGVDKVGRLDF